MNQRIIYGELVKAYENNDIKAFNEINEKYGLGLNSIEDVALVEDRPSFDLSRYYENYNPQYFKNYTTSRYITNIEPLPKYKLKERLINMTSYSYMIYHVLSNLQENPNLDEVLDTVELPISSEIAENILETEGFIEVDDDNHAEITEYGLFRLSGVSWVGFYDSFLDYFDFDDFEKYMQEYDTGDVIKNSLNYLNKHLKIAREMKDFDYLHDVFSSKAMVYLNMQEFKKSLLEELKIFALKINPIYLNNYDSYVAVEFPNINNINVLDDLSEVKSLKRVFYKAWNEMEFEKELMDKDEAFEYLTRAQNGELLDDLSAEIADKHFK